MRAMAFSRLRIQVVVESPRLAGCVSCDFVLVVNWSESRSNYDVNFVYESRLFYGGVAVSLSSRHQYRMSC